MNRIIKVVLIWSCCQFWGNLYCYCDDSFAEIRSDVSKQLSQIVDSLQTWQAVATVSMSERAINVENTYSGELVEDSVGVMNGIEVAFWIDSGSRKLRTDFQYDGPIVFQDAQGQEIWRTEKRDSSRQFTAILDSDTFIWFEPTLLLGPKLEGYPREIKLPRQFSPVCLVDDSTSILVDRELSVNPKVVLSFGHHETGDEWLEVLKAHSKLDDKIIVECNTSRVEGNDVWSYKLTLAADPHGVSFEYGFFPNIGYCPAWYKHREGDAMVVEQKWSWSGKSGFLAPETYEFYYSRAGLSGGTQEKWGIATSSVGTPIDQSVFSLSAINFEEFDRLHDLRSNELKYFDGIEFVPVEQFGKTPKKSNWSAGRIWFLLVSLAMMIVFYVAKRRESPTSLD